ncbi:alpha-2,8-sialyltransferase 8F-like isoform X3 [Girardinichthys multiradiatus]|uniref:alpha-2,8-sialyltransferase 8F-like isoform X3 n=1 Tax=Girardinichthys multiradiatus TaxID=208333 RepID=UPI001FADE018|nr:alpha-2,8-sialyltransferase 8F-like isoform X3 [Girardinichthys multiradiatus]XP_047214613.1 alpha-2,8-sialyltransferase 8F-like isoform X3 [Girardinichthys multiradiatus]
MRGQRFLYFSLLILGSLLTTFIWYTFNNNNQQLHQKTKKNAPGSSDSCKDCRKKKNKVLEPYTQVWKKNEENHLEFRTWLRLKCNGFENAIITQKNTPLGSKVIYDGEKKKTIKVTAEQFSFFFQGHPFSNKTRQTCAVVGNGGILANSSCGKMIDSAEFVIRCNLPPLSNGYEKHVGMKTDLVTANPSIFTKKYGSLLGRRRMFVESLCQYGNSMLLLPAFSFSLNTALCLRVLYTIEDFGSPIQPVFLNPKYLESLAVFWRSQGLKETRLSTGMMMTSLALDLCDDVHLYGFWPFSVHPHSFQDLTNHYYDDAQGNKVFHSMSDEFKLLLQLHNQGVLKLHLGECGANE